MSLRAFSVFVRGREQNAEIVNSRTSGQAKMEFLRMLDGCLPDIRYTDLRARTTGGPYTSDGFRRNASYRGLPHVRCGMRVMVGDARGVIVGHNSSANFDILFDKYSPKYSGLRMNVHPASITILEEEA